MRRLRGIRLRSARITLNGHRVKTLRGRRLKATIDLRNLPKGTVVVGIRARTTGGRVLKGKRVYRTCSPKRKHGPPPL